MHPDTHRCASCSETKSINEFYIHRRKDRGNREQVRPYCKKCLAAKNAEYKQRNHEQVAEYYRSYRQTNKGRWTRSPEDRRAENLRKYNITIEDYDMLEAQQSNLCAICRKPSTNRRRLHVDHCHTTGKVRGLLCFRCNTALGGFSDDVALLESAIKYLKSY